MYIVRQVVCYTSDVGINLRSYELLHSTVDVKVECYSRKYLFAIFVSDILISI